MKTIITINFKSVGGKELPENPDKNIVNATDFLTKKVCEMLKEYWKKQQIITEINYEIKKK